MLETDITFLDTRLYKGVWFGKKINSKRASTLQTNRNIPVEELLLVLPARREKRLYQRESAKAITD